MANYVESTLIGESESTFTVKVILQSDGVSGELANSPVIDCSELTPKLVGACMSIWEVWYQVSNFSIQLAWATQTVPEPIWVLAPGADTRTKFHRFGGLIDASPYSAGRLVMSTQGFLSVNNIGSFVLRMQKLSGPTPAFKLVGQVPVQAKQTADRS